MILCENWLLEMCVKDRQQAPTHSSLLVLEQSIATKENMNITSRDILLCMKSYSNTFFTQVGYVALAIMFPWAIEKWNSS
jgi:hypothetical protein